MGLRQCIFCDVELDASHRNLPSSRTEEHIFARWYRDEVFNNKIKMFTATRDSAPILHRQPALERLVNTGVCKQCNCGWMSKLETDIAPIVKRLTDGEDINGFACKEWELVARWTGKTASVLSHVTPQLARVPRSTSLSLHPNSEVRAEDALFLQSNKNRHGSGRRFSANSLRFRTWTCRNWRSTGNSNNVMYIQSSSNRRLPTNNSRHCI